MVKKVKVAVIGSGSISYTYLRNMTQTFHITEVVGCSDLIEERSRRRAEQFGVRMMTNEEILSDPEIEIVVNLTYPISHYEVTKAALEAGKHVHTEKMLATNYKDAKELFDLAEKSNLRISAAPDTFLGAGLQTARKLIDSGFIGTPFGAQAMVLRGYHLTGEVKSDRLPFVCYEGGNIPYDMGGYYMHALVALLGPAKRVAGFSRSFLPEITQRNPRHPDYHVPIPFNSDSIMSGNIEFHNGVFAGLTIVSESHLMEMPRFEIYGTEGTLILPDPNTFAGPVYLIRGKEVFRNYRSLAENAIPLTHGYGNEETPDPGVGTWEERMWRDCHRGIGVADLAWAIRNGRPHRCSAELGLHAIEVIYGIENSHKEDKFYTLLSKPAQPEPIPSGFIYGTAAEECLDTK